MSRTSEKIISRISYTLTDWVVSVEDEEEVLRLLVASPDINSVIVEIEREGMLDELIDRVSSGGNSQKLWHLLGGQLNPSNASKVRRIIIGGAHHNYGARAMYVKQFDRPHDLQPRLRALGVRGTTTNAAWAATGKPAYASVVPSGASAPFTGSGATGVSPTKGKVPLGDQWSMLNKPFAGRDSATVARYSNPLGGLGVYLAGLAPGDRKKQAKLLTKQPISTIYPYSYGALLPTRAQVFKAAASAHNLEPELVAGFLLAEARDQSSLEDAKDLVAARSVARANTSIGLGQVVVSTARRNDLFSDLYSSSTRSALTHSEIATHLASDEFNIFAAAKYLRQVADEGASRSLASLPTTAAEYPSLDLAKYLLNSDRWPDDNVRALGSEYTSRAWDDRISTGWGYFVFEAYKDIKSAGVF